METYKIGMSEHYSGLYWHTERVFCSAGLKVGKIHLKNLSD